MGVREGAAWNAAYGFRNYKPAEGLRPDPRHRAGPCVKLSPITAGPKFIGPGVEQGTPSLSVSGACGGAGRRRLPLASHAGDGLASFAPSLPTSSPSRRRMRMRI
jgi:hypothetical protein